VVAARYPPADGQILDYDKTLDWNSYNDGPTLREWM
jgi:hypothetical protein